MHEQVVAPKVIGQDPARTGTKYGIWDIAHFLPSGTLTNESIRESFGFEEDFLIKKLGIGTRHIAAANESTADLCVGAVRNLLDQTGIEPADIELLIVVTQTPDYCLPNTAALIHDALHLAHGTAAFDINLGCSGYIYGLSAANAFMTCNGMRAGILVTADQYSKILDPADRATVPLFGDAATATLMTAEPRYTLGRFTFGTDGGRHEAVIVRGSGTRAGAREPLQMNGRDVFTFMMSEVPNDIERCLAINGLRKEEIDAWVFHQASKYMLETLADRAGIDREKLIIDLEDVGNTTSSSIPLALDRSILRSGNTPDRVFLSGFGVGVSWASTVLTRTSEHGS